FTNCLLTQSRRAAENERRLIKGVGILIFWSYLTTFDAKIFACQNFSMKCGIHFSTVNKL
ncbi:MAG: hypothetical protein VSS75_008095, partial [Candidatus Parabeggiatoa sp.]|nr:hypothetical protein [Candidatus Parabeggiatoa sp.]